VLELLVDIVLEIEFEIDCEVVAEILNVEVDDAVIKREFAIVAETVCERL
jgi:hypothetical protein